MTEPPSGKPIRRRVRFLFRLWAGWRAFKLAGTAPALNELSLADSLVPAAGRTGASIDISAWLARHVEQANIAGLAVRDPEIIDAVRAVVTARAGSDSLTLSQQLFEAEALLSRMVTFAAAESGRSVEFYLWNLRMSAAHYYTTIAEELMHRAAHPSSGAPDAPQGASGSNSSQFTANAARDRLDAVLNALGTDIGELTEWRILHGYKQAH